ncbi:MAG TPA: glycosyl hydrolase family 28-related protein [Verrucomicrobiae bacterium]|nr:glycosyl hydrolase family 28-related protein [Verrucomicrobiae bacterium]
MLSNNRHRWVIIFWILILCASTPDLFAASYYPEKLNDPNALQLSPSGGDDTTALQAAIDKVQATTRQGIVLLAPGSYRITSTIHIWPGIRLIGCGAERPAITLPANTPGFGDAAHEKVLFFFAGRRPRNDTDPVEDASPGTFYSALANVDVTVENGNSGAVAVRARYAQHCFLAHMDFQLGAALAGIHEGGNVLEDVHFFGGNHAIWTSKPSPGWQFTCVDCSFTGQRGSAIFEHEAGLTLIRPQFQNVPAAVEIETNWADELWVKDARLEDISGPAFAFGLEKSPRQEINLEGITCRNVPVFAMLKDSSKSFSAPSEIYSVKTFSHGLDFSGIGAVPEIKTHFNAVPLATLSPPVASDLTPLPSGDWANVHDLGAKGDGQTDDTTALQNAVAQHRTLYFPTGFYRVHDTLALRADTVLIGLHPGATQIILPDNTPAFAGTGAPKALLAAPKGGSNIVIGIGLYTGGNNPRAVAALWKAGANSLMNDVRFLGGHGTPLPGGGRENPYNPGHTADPDPNRHWDSQYPSLWITDGGGGTFFDIWTPSTFARAGMLVSDTETPGRAYQISSEHHVHNEIQVHHSAHWSFYALQTEEEWGESSACLPIEIDSSRDITFANFHSYRVIRSYQPFPCAVKISGSRDIHFRNFHADSNSKVSFDASIYDQSHQAGLRDHEFASLDISGKSSSAKPSMPSSVVVRGAKVEKLAGGFFNISGGAVDSHGNYYFADLHPRRIYRWDAARQRLSTNEVSFPPVNAIVDQAGNVMVVSDAGDGTVYALNPDGKITALKSQPLSGSAGKNIYLPVSDWHLNRDSLSHPTAEFISPDGTTVMPVGESFLTGETSWGVKSSPQNRSFGFDRAVPGKPFYITDESNLRTWQADVNADGSLTNFQLFAEQGGEAVTTDAHGNVYLAAGQIYVYDSTGKMIDTLEVPGRPTQLLFGGPDGKTLFIAARTALYSVLIK